MQISDIGTRGWGKSEVIVDNTDDFLEMVDTILSATSGALPKIEHTTFQVRFQFWGCWYALELGEWDDHVQAMRAAGWVH